MYTYIYIYMYMYIYIYIYVYTCRCPGGPGVDPQELAAADGPPPAPN